MSIRERKPGVWEVRVYAGRDPVTGRAREVSRTVRGGRKAARAREATLTAELADAHPGTDATVGQAVTAVIDHLERLGRARSTIAGYRSIAKSISADQLAGVSWRALRSRDVDAYYSRMSAAGQTPMRIGHHHALLRLVGNWAVRWEWAPVNVVRMAVRPTEHARRIAAPEGGDIVAVLAVATVRSPEMGVALQMLALLGCRRGEVCGIRWSDVDGDRLTIRRAIDELPGGGTAAKSTKTHQERTVDLGPTAVSVLDGHRERMVARAAGQGVAVDPDGYVLSDDLSMASPWRPGRITLAWRRARDTVGVRGLRLHDLRHWHASVLLDAGEDAVVVAARLGHADASTTRSIYAHLVTGSGVRAAGIVDDALAAAHPH